MTGPGGWGILDQAAAAGGARPVVAADAGYGDNTTFRLELGQRGWQYVVAVKGTTSARAGDARPVTPRRRGGPGRPPKAAYPGPPANLRTLAIANADKTRQVTWRRGTKATRRNPAASMTSHFLAIRVRPANRDIPRCGDGSLPELLAAGRMARRSGRAHRLLAVQPARRHPHRGTRPAGQDPLADRARLPRTENRPGPGPLRRTLLPWLAPPRHPRRPRPGVLHPAAHRPKSPCAGMSLYQVLHELQIVLALILGACPLCCQPLTLARLAAARAGT